MKRRGLSKHRRHNSRPIAPKGNPRVPEMCKKIRATLRWSQSRLAKELGCHLASVYRWENGDFLPHAKHLVALYEIRSRMKRGELKRGNP